MNIKIDLNIVSNDLSLDQNLSPAQLNATNVIAQDVKHRILESGLAVQLVGLRNEDAIEVILTNIELVAEQDERLIPGTIFVNHLGDGQIELLAETTEA